MLGMLLGLLPLATLYGCGGIGPDVIKLTGGLREPVFLVEGGARRIEMVLLVRNDGNRRLRVFSANGGCSCRQVDQSVFPRDLVSGEQLKVPFAYDLGRGSYPVAANFTFDTDRGSIPLVVPFYPLSGHQLEPEAPACLAIGDAEGWDFDLIHRSIFKTGGTADQTKLMTPPQLDARVTETHTGLVAGAPGFSFKDITYHLSLKDRRMGLHKAVILLIGPDGSTLAESSAVWNRVPFLSSVPERVALGGRPVRVFLRCPDETVELTKVLSAPPGTRAVVSSAREVTVIPADDYKGTISGTVEVGTTSADRSPLRFPVVRYVSQGSVAVPRLKTGGL